jgi:hypothetical protein
VTSRGGIIYVSNVTALHKMPDTLKWVLKFYTTWNEFHLAHSP